MRLSALAKLIEIFTPERARLYALLMIMLGCVVVVASIVESPERLTDANDFPAFYNAGRIVNEYSGKNLYDSELQRRLYIETAPAAAVHRNLFFVYTPFFALVFAPLAMLPYSLAFGCWILLSLALFTAGFRLSWTAASLPIQHRSIGFVLALTFLPFLTWCLFTGQTSAFGFFWLALAIYLEHKGRPLASGCALAVLLYKPTLLIFLVPMLVLTRRLRTLLGFCIASVGLGVVSLAIIGFSGVSSYLNMLASFSRDKASGVHPNWADVDAFSFFLPLVSGNASLARWLVLILSLGVCPFLIAAWLRKKDASWAHAITWTIVLNFYVLIYDSTFIILSVLLSIEPQELAESKLSLGFRWFLFALLIMPWFETNLALKYGFHPLTIVFFAFGCYQLHRTLRTPRAIVTAAAQKADFESKS